MDMRKSCPHYSEIQDMNATIKCCDLYGTGSASWGKCDGNCERLQSTVLTSGVGGNANEK